MDFEEITPLWKDSQSNVGNCPALCKVPNGYLVTGKNVGEQTRARVDGHFGVGEEESVVFVPDNVIERIRNTA